MRKKTVGLCAGRHPLPVEEYIFPAELNPTDFDTMRRIASDFLVGVDHVTVYVTGLTAAMLAVVSVCASRGIGLTAMHFDRSCGEYLQQEIIVAEICPCCGTRVTGGQFCPSCGAH